LQRIVNHFVLLYLLAQFGPETLEAMEIYAPRAGFSARSAALLRGANDHGATGLLSLLLLTGP
jgi:hypothetical protein